MISTYTSTYCRSRALVIGINEYQHTSPLQYAVSDAISVAEALTQHLGFATEDVVVLTNQEACRSEIFKAFLSFASGDVDANERIIVFFAGHGHTITSLRGEVGYLVPSDGRPEDLSSLLRWDDLTRNADLIPAKHILFIMDACYGGLAVTRLLRPGAMRFLRDMMQRTSRQVLSAGKADELVSDLGGPLPNHSVFTGHLLEALMGKAKDNNGNLTANGVLSYVYQAVSSDSTSHQTPHYGHLHGDGDMIFYPIPSNNEESAVTSQDERLMIVPAVIQREEEELDDQQQLKELLSEIKHKIQLHDFVVQRTRELLSLTGEDYFSVQGSVTNELFLERLGKYEQSIHNSLKNEILLARWGEVEHLEALRLPLRRLAERIAPTGGMTYLIESRWYPVLLLLIAGSLGALAGENFKALKYLIYTPVPNPYGNSNGTILLMACYRAVGQIHDGFKLIPGYENHRTPRSEHIFKLLQPIADDLLFVGNDYENLYDRCEIFLSLEYMHIEHPAQIEEDERVWSPLGRFAWKHENPLANLVAEAKSAGQTWPPLTAGLFGGSLERFLQLSSALTRLCARTGWNW